MKKLLMSFAILMATLTAVLADTVVSKGWYPALSIYGAKVVVAGGNDYIFPLTKAQYLGHDDSIAILVGASLRHFSDADWMPFGVLDTNMNGIKDFGEDNSSKDGL